MDRFKFRVWDKKMNKFIEYGDLFQNANIDFICLEPDGTLQIGEDIPYEGFMFADIKIQHFIINQCTGLKDKNGTLIFEGDVVKECSGNPYKHEVTFRNGSFLFESKYGSVSLYDINLTKDNRFDNCVIIGNIYENKELLE